MKCQNCGSENLDTAKFCHNCGTVLLSNEELTRKITENEKIIKQQEEVIERNKLLIKEQESTINQKNVAPSDLRLLLLYKYDKKEGSYSLSLTKIITIVVVALTFLWRLRMNVSGEVDTSLLTEFLVILIMGLLTYISGLIVRYIIKKLN
ncbi:MAG: zinc ribbon domain-containing protein [Methanobrevibacter sp.]|nr:zinc ribbon domain-containing protein [Methanobrevibacter sp.]